MSLSSSVITVFFYIREVVLKHVHCVLGISQLRSGYDVVAVYDCPLYNFTWNDTVQFPEIVNTTELNIRLTTSGRSDYYLAVFTTLFEFITFPSIYIIVLRTLFGKKDGPLIFNLVIHHFIVELMSFGIDVLATAYPLSSVLNKEVAKTEVSSLEFAYVSVGFVYILISILEVGILRVISIIEDD